MASDVSPFRAATMLVTSSGREVPIAMTVSAMSVSVMPAASAIFCAAYTTALPPAIIRESPRIIKSMLFQRESDFELLSVFSSSSCTGFLRASKIRYAMYATKMISRTMPKNLFTVPAFSCIFIEKKDASKEVCKAIDIKMTIVITIEMGKSRFNMTESTGNAVNNRAHAKNS